MKLTNKIIILICLIGFLSCKTIQYVPVPEIQKEYITKTDTTIIQDSIYIKEWAKADTVYLDRFKYKYIYNIKTDTIFKTDTTTVIKEVEVPVKFVPAYYKKINACFWILVIIIGLFIVAKIYFRVR